MNKNEPLHGVRLDRILDELSQRYSWQQLADKIPINCFKNNPSIKSSLAFLRKTPWARQKVETLWIWTFVDKTYQPPATKPIQASNKTNQPQKNSQAAEADFNPWLKNKR